MCSFHWAVDVGITRHPPSHSEDRRMFDRVPFTPVQLPECSPPQQQKHATAVCLRQANAT